MITTVLALLTQTLTQSSSAASVQYCEADCFSLDRSGSTLYYSGSVRALQNQTSDAFQEIRDACQNGILLKRTMKSVYLVEVPEWNTENESETRTHYGYRYNVTRTRNRSKSYVLTRPELRAQYETTEATEANSCREAKPSDFPLRPTDNEGNDILG